MMEIDERYFEMANAEFEHNRNGALWTKCLTLAEGNETTARYKYINEVARRLGGKGEHPTQQRNRPIDDGAGFPRKFIRGDFGMARTFWFGLVGYCLIKWMIAAGIRIAAMSMSSSARQALVRFVPLEIGFHLAISCLLVIAVWRASLRYDGDFFWVIVTRFVLVLFVAWVCFISAASYGIYLEATGQI